MSPHPVRRLPFLERCLRAAAREGQRGTGAAGDAQALRESVRRELVALFNAAALSRVLDLDAYPEVQRSTLGYGLPDLTGKTASSIDRAELEQAVLRAVQLFEPRLAPDSIRVRVLSGSVPRHNRLSLAIEGELVNAAERSCFRTELDLESGEVSVLEPALP